MSAAYLAWLAETSWQVAVLVVLVLVLQRVLARWLTPRWRYALWLLVVCRLAVPFQPSVPRGIWCDDLRPPVLRAGPSGGGGAELSRPRVRAIGTPPVRRPGEASGPAAVERTLAPASSRVPLEPAAPPPQRRGGHGIARWLLLLHLTGAGIYLLRAAGRELLFRRRLSGARAPDDPLALALLEELRRALGIRRPVALLATDAVDSPAVVGVRRPRVLVPAPVLASLAPEELRSVLLHELAHVRRGDVALNGLLALVRSAYWFHPLVHLALDRLRAAQESARDWDALASLGAPSARPYAETLIKLLEPSPAGRTTPTVGFLAGRRLLERRLLMITRFRPTSLRGRILGASLVGALGWFAFTSSATPLPAGLHEAQDEGRTLHVERQDTPAWRASLGERLGQVVDAHLTEASLVQVIDLLRLTSGVNFVLQPDVAEELAGQAFSLDVERKPLEQVLAIVCSMAGDDLDFGLVDEAVYVGWRWSIPHSFELRFYDVGSLLAEAEMEHEEGMGRLDELLRAFTGPPGSWDEYDEVSIRAWKDLLVVAQTEQGHRSVEAFLQRLLDRGHAGAPASARWREELDEALAREISVEFHQVRLAEVVDYLAQVVAVPVIADRDSRDVLVSLQVGGVSARSVFDLIARLTELNVRVIDGAILLDDTPDFTIEMYPVGDLLGEGDADEAFEEVEALIRESVDRETWDEWNEPRIERWGDLLVVQQTPAVHERLASFLEALRRASR